MRPKDTPGGGGRKDNGDNQKDKFAAPFFLYYLQVADSQARLFAVRYLHNISKANPLPTSRRQFLYIGVEPNETMVTRARCLWNNNRVVREQR